MSPHGRLYQENGVWFGEFLNRTEELGPKIDWTGTSTRPERQLWDMNLHYFEYGLDLRPGQTLSLILDWIDRCRPDTVSAFRTSWTPYAVSLRLSAWGQFLHRHHESIPPDAAEIMAASMAEQVHFLITFLESDVRGNHIIKNLRAILETAHCLEASPETARWIRFAARHLRTELDHQILPDGVHFERCLSYHSQVFCDLLRIYECRAVLEQEPNLTGALQTALGKMAQALCDLTHPDGQPIQFGDTGLSMCVSPETALTAYATLFDHRPAPQSDMAYEASRFYGRRTNRSAVFFKLGPLGPDDLMAHAHGDWGSFEWSLAGERVIVDQGVFEYVAGEKRRRSKSTQSHNTMTINQAEQADFFGAFRCGQRPTSFEVLRDVQLDRLTLDAKMKSVGDAQWIRRRVQIEGEMITLEDEAPNARDMIHSRLLFHPDVTPIQIDNTSLELNRQDQIIARIRVFDADIQIEPAVWWPNMGVELPTHRLTLQGEGMLRFEISIA
jgi:uncharacterized heparinase superfamily protein